MKWRPIIYPGIEFIRQAAYWGSISQSVLFGRFVKQKEIWFLLGPHMPRGLKTLHLFFSETQSHSLRWIRFPAFLQLTQTRTPSKLRQNSLAQCWNTLPSSMFPTLLYMPSCEPTLTNSRYHFDDFAAKSLYPSQPKPVFSRTSKSRMSISRIIEVERTPIWHFANRTADFDITKHAQAC